MPVSRKRPQKQKPQAPPSLEDRLASFKGQLLQMKEAHDVLRGKTDTMLKDLEAKLAEEEAKLGGQGE